MPLRLRTSGVGCRGAAASTLKWDADVINVVSHTCRIIFFLSDSNRLDLRERLTVAELGSPSFSPRRNICMQVGRHRSSNEIFTRCRESDFST